MTERPARIVDTHVHLWDPTRTDWYPYLAGNLDIGMGDVSSMARPFDVATYRAEAAGWNVEKLVNVAAATGLGSVDEAVEIGRRADAEGEPAAIIGGIAPTETVAEAVALLDRQAEVAAFRGVRPMGSFPGGLPDAAVLGEIEARGLLFELLARPHQLASAAEALAPYDDLAVVVEHTGWLQTGTDEERAVWASGLAALAGLGERVHCKLSGLAAAVGSMSAPAFAPYLDHAIDLFGVDRCCFASNFPVDGLHGTLDELWSAYSEATAAYSDAERDQLFATNAERLYRI